MKISILQIKINLFEIGFRISEQKRLSNIDKYKSGQMTIVDTSSQICKSGSIHIRKTTLIQIRLTYMM